MAKRWIAGLLWMGLGSWTRRGIARGFADSAAALFLTKLKTRVRWHGGQLTEAPRHFPSTRMLGTRGRS